MMLSICRNRLVTMASATILVLQTMVFTQFCSHWPGITTQNLWRALNKNKSG